MRLLFAITICSFCAGLCVALALVRRIRRQQVSPARPDADSTQEFFEAGEYRTPRPLRLDQEILRQKPRRPLSEFTFTTVPRVPVMTTTTASKPKAQFHSGQVTVKPETAFATLNGLSVPIARIESPLSPAAPPAADTSIANFATDVMQSEISGLRKAPQSVRTETLRRIDLALNNNQAGDPVDPYGSLVRGSGTRGPVISSHPDRRSAMSQS